MNKKYTILLLGSGGREHAFAWKINQSSLCNKLFVAPGNAGTSEIAENVNLSINDFESIGKFSLKNNIDFILVGPEEPLVKGIKNYFLENITLNHIPVIGPDKFGAMLEGSKDFAKEFMIKYKIPTALYHTFTPQNISEGISHIKNQTLPIVLKADGLAAGKGVIIAQSHKEAEDALKNMLGGQFGEAGNKVVIEDFLKGIEVSVFVLTDGETNVGNSLNKVEGMLKAFKIPIYTIGYNANVKVLQNLSSINEAASINADSEDVVYKLENLFNAQM